MRALVLCLAVGSFVLAGCGQSDNAVPSKPVPPAAAGAAGAQPKKGAVVGAEGSFNGPGAAGADSRAGSKVGR